MAVSFLDGIFGNFGRLFFREQHFRAAVLFLAFTHVSAAALNHEFAEEFVVEQYLFRLDLIVLKQFTR